MAVTLTEWLRHLRGRLPGEADAVPDTELLRRFAEHRDEAAFAALVARYGPMVFGVCRRVCGPTPDAEDAFQAAFVILAIKVEAVVRSGRVGAWLHGVAFHTARKARDRSRRSPRPAGEDAPFDQLPARPEPADADAAELRGKLDEVLAGLPAKYRECVVMCELEGVSRKEAAGRLRWTEGTLSGRLARARKLLADRLARRGVALGTVVLSAQAAPAAVPAELAASALTGATLIRAGTAVPAGVAALAREVTRSMFPTKLKLTTALAATGVLAAGLGTLLATPNDRAPVTVPVPAQPAPHIGDAVSGGTVPKPATPTWNERATFTHPAGVNAVAFGPDVVAAGDALGGVVIWDVRENKLRRKVLDGEKAPVRTSTRWVSFNPDATWLFMSHDNGNTSAVSLDPKKFAFPGFGFPGTKVFGFSADGKFYFHSGLNNPKEVVMMQNDLPKGVVGGLIVVGFRHDKEVVLAALADDGTVMATATEDGAVHYWPVDAKDSKWRTLLSGFTPTALAVGAGGKTAAGGKDGTLYLLDADGDPKHQLAGHAGAVNALAFSPDGKLLISAGADKVVRLWDTSTGKELAVLKGHTDEVKAVAVCADGSLIASGSADKTVRVWELRK